MGGREGGREGERERERDRQRDRETERHRERHRERDRQTDRQTETERQRERLNKIRKILRTPVFVYLLEIRLQISLDQQNSQGSAFRTVLMIMMVLMMWEPSFFITRLSPEVMQLVLFFSLKIIIIRFTAQQNHSPKRKYSNLGCLNARTHARTHARTPPQISVPARDNLLLNKKKKVCHKDDTAF